MNTVETTLATLEASAPAKYFHYSQNNSGGSFDIDDKVAHHVIIQAHSASEANKLAEDVAFTLTAVMMVVIAVAAATAGVPHGAMMVLIPR
jgi:uncharacterized membrane protein